MKDFTMPSVFAFVKELSNQLRSSGRIRAAESLVCSLHSFRSFREGKDIDFGSFTRQLMEEYQGWMLTRGLKRNTTSYYMRSLRVAYNTAVETLGITDIKPFKHVYTGIDKTVKRAIGIDKIRLIRSLDLSKAPKLAFARDMWMLCLYLRGISFVDLAHLHKCDLCANLLSYSRKKTGQRLIMEWTPEMQIITERYPSSTAFLLPIISREDGTERRQYQSKLALVNRHLKKIGEMAGVDISLTTYCSRHSWATLAQELHVPLSVISKGLGHDNERTTQIYLDSIRATEVDAANRRIIEVIKFE